MTAAELQATRGELGITQAELAVRLGVSRRQLQYWEAGTWPVPQAIALAIESIVRTAKPKRKRP